MGQKSPVGHIQPIPGLDFYCVFAELAYFSLAFTADFSSHSAFFLSFLEENANFSNFFFWFPDENHRRRLVDPKLRPALPETVLLYGRHSHRHLPYRSSQASCVRGQKLILNFTFYMIDSDFFIWVVQYSGNLKLQGVFLLLSPRSPSQSRTTRTPGSPESPSCPAPEPTVTPPPRSPSPPPPTPRTTRCSGGRACSGRGG